MARRSRLAVLIRLAQLEEHRRLAELGGAAQRATDAATRLVALRQQLDRASEASFALTSRRSAADLVQALRHRQSLDLEQARAEQRRGEADGALEVARARTAAARHRLRAIQKVERKRALLERRAERRRQQRRQETLERALREGAEHAG